MTTLTPACLVCGEGVGHHVFSWAGGYEIYRCRTCQSAFTHPLPTPSDLDTFYQGFLYKKPNPDGLPNLVQERRAELVKLFSLEKQTTEGTRFLDHGGGTGVAFGAAQTLGFECYFCDIDEQAARFVQEAFGLDEQHWLRDLTPATEHFDCVLSDNVIEHVIDPLELLLALYGSLRAGGKLVVKTPHVSATEHYFYPRTLKRYLRTAARYNGWQSVGRMLTTDRTWYCDPPRHLYSFSATGLAALCRRAGIVDFELGHYRTKFLSNTLTERFLRTPKTIRGMARRGMMLPGVGMELVLKPLQLLGLSSNLLTPGGLLLQITKH